MSGTSLQVTISAVTIEKTMRQCDVCLVLIGRRWLTAADEYGQRKLDKADDWVRMEIGAALARGIDMIPVLVDGALAMPVDQALPGELVRLRFMQARPIRDLTFHQDVDLLIDEIKKAISTLTPRRFRRTHRVSVASIRGMGLSTFGSRQASS